MVTPVVTKICTDLSGEYTNCAVFFNAVSESEWDRTGFEMESLVLAATVALLSLLAPSASQEANTTLPLKYRPRTIEGGEQVCGPDKERQRLQVITRNDLSKLLRNNLQAIVPCSDKSLSMLERCPAASCNNVAAQSQVLRPSGYYWIRSSNELQCRSTVTWTGCVAATALEGGHMLPTST